MGCFQCRVFVSCHSSSEIASLAWPHTCSYSPADPASLARESKHSAKFLSWYDVQCRYELLMQYFQIKLNFDTRDQSHMFFLAGICGMVVQLIVLRLLLRCAGKMGMLLIGEALNLCIRPMLDSSLTAFLLCQSAQWPPLAEFPSIWAWERKLMCVQI